MSENGTVPFGKRERNDELEEQIFRMNILASLTEVSKEVTRVVSEINASDDPPDTKNKAYNAVYLTAKCLEDMGKLNTAGLIGIREIPMLQSPAKTPSSGIKIG